MKDVKYVVDHREFAGVICEADFETDYPNYMSAIAERIISADKFNERCARNIELKHRYGKKAWL